MKRFVFLILLSVVSAASLLQAQTTNSQRARWMGNIRQQKIEYIVKELKLNEEQADKFTRLYTEMESEIYKLNCEAEDLLNKIALDDKATDAEYEAAALASTRVKQKEGEIELEYFHKFSRFLTKKQLFQMKLAEEKFTQYLLRHRRRENK